MGVLLLTLFLGRAAASGLDQAYPALFNLYKDLHAHPELSFQEKDTAARIAAALKALGIEVTEKVGGHGLVGVLKNGPGPVVMVRADLDALPVTEKTGLAFASRAKAMLDGRETDVAHACGHDVHMTALVGTARLLSESKGSWSGTVLFVGQPAEERGGGAKAMLADGLFKRFPRPDYVLGLHVNAELPAGQVGVIEGYGWAYVNMVDLVVRGVGGHGAFPHRTKDPVVLASEIVLALQTIVSRETAPGEPAVVTVGSIHGGTKHNIIPDEVKLQITVRALSDETRQKLLDAIKRIARGQGLSAGLPEDRLPVVTILDEETPSIYNDPELTRRVSKAFRESLGAANVVTTKPVMGGDDFAYYGRETPPIPSFYFWVGAVDPAKLGDENNLPPSLHSSAFAPLAEPTIKTAVKAMSAAVLELLRKP